MKTCPKCERRYDDKTLNFCLEDGEWLLENGPGDEPATAVMSTGISALGKLPEEKETQIYTSGDFISKEIKRHKFGAALVIGAVVVVLAGFGYGLYKFLEKRADNSPARTAASVTTVRLTGDGKARGAEISPDGKFLAYIRTEGGESSIWLKQIQTNSNIEVVKPGELADFNAMVFSPDGNFLYFNAVSGRPDAASNSGGAYVANIDGSNERKIISRGGTAFLTSGATWSPDGRMLAVAAGDDSQSPQPNHSLIVVSIADGSETAVGSRWARMQDVVWHPSGDSILVNGADNSVGSGQIWEVGYPDGTPRRLTNNLNGHTSISITSDGRSLVTGEIFARTAVWVSPDRKPENAKPVMPASGDTWGFSWAPDGRIVYVSDQTGEAEVWIMNADGSNAKPLTNDRLFKSVPVVTPDGRYIVYWDVAGGGRLVRIDINGGNPLVFDKSVGPDNPDISRDSRWILYSAWIDGLERLVRLPIEGGDPQPITEYRATEPRYSWDGTRIACFVLNEKTLLYDQLAIIPAEGGPPIKTFPVPQNTNIGRGPVWTPDDRGITMIVSPGELQNIWLQPIDGGDAKPMTNFQLPGVARRDYSRDGKRIALVRGEGYGNAIMITDFR